MFDGERLRLRLSAALTCQLSLVAHHVKLYASRNCSPRRTATNRLKWRVEKIAPNVASY